MVIKLKLVGVSFLRISTGRLRLRFTSLMPVSKHFFSVIVGMTNLKVSIFENLVIIINLILFMPSSRKCCLINSVFIQFLLN